ncbi:MAG: carbamoyltransferase C-terminal domain-containing protein [candidate division WOR-3 bacterium]|jgi:carbamoyltransferase
MYYLGIHDGHTATACLFKDGKIIACISEERINRIKEWGGFPKLAILEILKIANIKPSDIKAVGVSSIFPPIRNLQELEKHILKRLIKHSINFIPKSIIRNKNVRHLFLEVYEKFSNRKEYLKRELESIGIKAKLNIYEHHYIHAFTSHILSKTREENLIITLDGSGDLLSGTISIGRNDKIERISEISNYDSLGEFYMRITQFLGMKPLSHEYKVMGLSAYVDENDKYAKEIYEIFKTFFEVKDLNIINKTGAYKSLYLKLFERKLANKRFDYIAFGAQKLIEEIVVELVKNAIRKTNIRNVVLGGGVFMNVKLNNKILMLNEVEKLFIMPSCSDESLAIGCAIKCAIDDGFYFNNVQFLQDIYWGSSYDKQEIEKAFEELNENEFEIKYIGKDIDELVGELIAQNYIIARFSGRMEFGARALGNRSILANPKNLEVITKINKAIKQRDFWMPFAPTILYEEQEKYIINPKNHEGYYMIMAFFTKEEAHKHLRAALHQYDLSARPQILKEEHNPRYYKLIKKFKEKTGIGGILNTSFNLHGEPIVMSPKDAIYTLNNSQLDALAIEDYLIIRKKYKL